MTLITRTNRAQNSNFHKEDQTNNWSASNGTLTWAQVELGDIDDGQGALVGSGSGVVTTATQTATGLTIGQTYIASAEIRIEPGTHPPMFLTFGTATSGASASSNSSYTRLSVTFVATATSHTFGVKNTSTASVVFCWIRRFLVEAGSTLLPWFDGDQPACTWTAGPGQSTSTMLYETDTTARVARCIVEVAGGPRKTGEFLLGTSALGGADILTRDKRWIMLPGVVRSATIDRGRTDEKGAVDGGSATIVVDNTDGAYDFGWSSSSLMEADGTSALLKGAMVRVSAVFELSGQLYFPTVFTGRLQTDLDLDIPIMSEVTLAATDDWNSVQEYTLPTFEPPDGANSVLLPRDGDGLIDRLQWLLQVAAGFGSDVDPGFDTGVLSAPAAAGALYGVEGGTTIADELSTYAVALAIVPFMDVRNQITTRTPGEVDSGLTITDTITTPASQVDSTEFHLSPGMAQIVNQSTVNRGVTLPEGSGLDAFTGVASTSVDRFGIRPVQVTVPFKLDTAMDDLAYYLAYSRALPVARLAQATVETNAQTAAWPLLFALELQNKIGAVRHTPWGRTITFTDLAVEGIKHEIDDQRWDITISTSPLTGYGVIYSSSRTFSPYQ